MSQCAIMSSSVCLRMVFYPDKILAYFFFDKPLKPTLKGWEKPFDQQVLYWTVAMTLHSYFLSIVIHYCLTKLRNNPSLYHYTSSHYHLRELLFYLCIYVLHPGSNSKWTYTTYNLQCEPASHFQLLLFISSYDELNTQRSLRCKINYKET